MGGGKQCISGIDRLLDSPEVPYRGPMASGFALVLDVIMNEREVMQEFDRHADRSGGRGSHHWRRRPAWQWPAGAVPAALDPDLIGRRGKVGVGVSEVIANHPCEQGRPAVERGEAPQSVAQLPRRYRWPAGVMSSAWSSSRSFDRDRSSTDRHPLLLRILIRMRHSPQCPLAARRILGLVATV